MFPYVRHDLACFLGPAWDDAGCILGVGKVTLLLFWGSCPPRWCWSALWRRTWCTQRQTPPSTTGKLTTESLGSPFKAPLTLEPSTEEWGKPSRTSLKVAWAWTLHPWKSGQGVWVRELGRGMCSKSALGLGGLLYTCPSAAGALILQWASPSFRNWVFSSLWRDKVFQSSIFQSCLSRLLPVTYHQVCCTAFFYKLGFHTSDGNSDNPGSLFAVKSHLTESLLNSCLELNET